MTLVREPDWEIVHEARHEGNRMSEDALVHAYRAGAVLAVPAPEACVCGGVIEPTSFGTIPAAVAIHNRTQQHLAWRARMGIR